MDLNPYRKQGQCKAWHIPSTKNLTLWPLKSIGFQIFLRTKHVPNLVKIHWRMLRKSYYIPLQLRWRGNNKLWTNWRSNRALLYNKPSILIPDSWSGGNQFFSGPNWFLTDLSDGPTCLGISGTLEYPIFWFTQSLSYMFFTYFPESQI